LLSQIRDKVEKEQEKYRRYQEAEAEKKADHYLFIRESVAKATDDYLKWKKERIMTQYKVGHFFLHV